MQLNHYDTPCLWVDLDIMESNIQHLAVYFKSRGLEWRPHTKGIKIPEIAKLAINAGAFGVTCAKLSEAELMTAAGVQNILIANQVVGEQKIERLCQLSRFNEIIVAVDHLETVQLMNQIAEKFAVTLNVLLEVNTGMNRAGLDPGQPVLDFYRAISELKFIQNRGLMAWEGHTATIADPDEKVRSISASMEKLSATVSLCREHGILIEIISGGGSGTYTISSNFKLLTEIQAGGVIFTDVAYSKWGAETQPSLFLRSLVTSRPSPKRIITDTGWKTLPGWSVAPKPLGVDAVGSVSFSSEHGVIHLTKENTSLRPGDPLDYMVGYGDNTVFLHERLYGVRNGEVETIWEVRGRGRYT